MMMMMVVMPPLITIIRIALTITITPFPYTSTPAIPISAIRIRALRMPSVLCLALPLPLPLPFLFMFFMPLLQLMPYNSARHNPKQRRRASMSKFVPCKPTNRRTKQRRPDIFCPVMVTDARAVVGALFAAHATTVPIA